MRRTLFAIALLMVLAGCASPQPAPLPPTIKTQPPPAWIMEPGPNLRQLLDDLISPYETGSTEQARSLRPVKTN